MNAPIIKKEEFGYDDSIHMHCTYCQNMAVYRSHHRVDIWGQARDRQPIYICEQCYQLLPLDEYSLSKG